MGFVEELVENLKKEGFSDEMIRTDDHPRGISVVYPLFTFEGKVYEAFCIWWLMEDRKGVVRVEFTFVLPGESPDILLHFVNTMNAKHQDYKCFLFKIEDAYAVTIIDIKNINSTDPVKMAKRAKELEEILTTGFDRFINKLRTKNQNN